MSFNILLIQLVCFSCVLFLVQARQAPRGWILVSSLILLVLAGTFLLLPDYAGWISGGLWFGLVLLPQLGYAKVNRLVSQERFGSARKLARLIRWLHPMDGYIEYPELLWGLELGQQGKIDEATQILKQYQTTATATGRTAIALLYRLRAQWQEAVTWMRQNVPEETVFNAPSLGVIYLRALGETGDLNGLLQGLGRLERRLEKTGDLFLLSLVRMFALAFCGHVKQVQTLLNGPLAVYPANIQQFWLATAELAAGNNIAKQKLAELRDRADTVQKNAIDWRLSQPRVDLEHTLTHSSRQILAEIETTIQQEARYSIRSSFQQGQIACGTYALLGANLLMFATESFLGGSDNLQILYWLGAMVAEQVFAGEWWRLLNAMFLHLGVVHLAANMVALYFFGKFVESRLGIGRFLLAYFISGIGSMLTIAYLAILTGTPEQFCVGASGAIMGLLGVTIAILLKGWRRDKAKIARKRLLFILLVVVLQTISDLLTPQVSVVGHAAGLIIGFIVGSLLVIRNEFISH